MDNHKEIQDELMETSPLLSKLKEVPSFEVPIAYFNDLEEKVLHRIESNEKPPKVININRRLVGVAAAIVLILASIFLFNQQTVSDATFANSSSEDSDLYMEYLVENPDEIDLDLLVEGGLFDDMDVESTSLNDGIKPIDSTNLYY